MRRFTKGIMVGVIALSLLSFSMVPAFAADCTSIIQSFIANNSASNNSDSNSCSSFIQGIYNNFLNSNANSTSNSLPSFARPSTSGSNCPLTSLFR